VSSARQNVDALHPVVTPGIIDTAGQVGVVAEGAGKVLQTWEPFLDKLKVFVKISEVFEEVSSAPFSGIYNCFIGRARYTPMQR
jgi:hypothetical protein